MNVETVTTEVTYVMTRNCCTSGNCFHCGEYGDHPTPHGTPARIEHWRGTDRKYAERLVLNWASYAPTITEA